MSDVFEFKAESKAPSQDDDPDTMTKGVSPTQSASPSSLFHRQIKFVPSKMPFTGMGIGGGGDFVLETLNNSSNKQLHGLINPCQSALTGKKKDSPEFLESSLDPEISFEITVRRIGAGLANLGNTCFLNSVLQCLTYTEPLAAYLQSGKHQNSCHIAGFCALCAIQKHVSNALKSTGRILAPNDLVSNLRCISRNFRRCRQEDAHEYMVNLLESMHKCCLPTGVPSESPSAYEKSLVHKIFGGRLRSQVKCMQCSYCSNKFDPFLDLSLEIAKADSLKRALWNFTAAEELDGGEKQYQCQRCKQKVRAVKQLTVHKAPYVLTIHLKRFRAHDPGQKIDRKVQFGPTLDLKSYVSGSYDGDLKYTLYGVLVHLGWSTRSGHYYCFVRTSSGMWYSLDDNRVVQVSERTVLEQKAYMLFYVRDRKSVAPKKHADVEHKENMKANISGNRPCFTFNQVKNGRVENGQFERSSTGASPTAVIPRNVSDASLSKENTLKLNNTSTVVERSVSKEVHVSRSPQVSSSKNANSSAISSEKPNNASTVVGCSMSKEVHVSRSPVEVSSSKGPNSEPSPDIPLPKDQQKALSVLKKDTSDLASVPLNYSHLHGSGNDNIVKSKTYQKVDLGLNDKEGVLCSVDRDKMAKIINPVDTKPSKSGACISRREKANDDGPRSVASDRIELSSSSKNGLLQKKNCDCIVSQKSKKKLLKCKLACLHIGPSILFRMSVGVRKKKHRRRKCCGSRNEGLSKEHLLGDGHIFSDVGPSTSKEAGAKLRGSPHSRKKRSRSCAETEVNPTATATATRVELDFNGSIIRDATEFEDKNGQSGIVLATNKQFQMTFSSSATAPQSDATKSNSAKFSKRDATQNCLNRLTQGIDQPIARWDDIELPLGQCVESNTTDSVSIGYIPDEWDEEYDRGKRKKVRLVKECFGGPNPFQEVATKKVQGKMAKMNHPSASANRPFRI